MWLSYNKIFSRLSYIKLVLSVIDFENFGGARMREVNYNIKDEADAISIKALSGIIELNGVSNKNNGKENGGEVFTPHWCVVNMCNLVDDKISELKATVLEPACGSGNILIEVVRRKLATAYRISKTAEELRENILWAYKSVYGIDIEYSNVYQSRVRLSRLLDSFLVCSGHNDIDCKNEVNSILELNIIHGDALTEVMYNCNGIPEQMKLMNWQTGEFEGLSKELDDNSVCDEW